MATKHGQFSATVGISAEGAGRETIHGSFEGVVVVGETALAGHDGSYVFNPPSYREGMRDRFWTRFDLPKGQSIVRMPVGNTTVLTLQQPMVNGDLLVGKVDGVDYFIGGHEYHLGVSAAVELERAGFHVDGFDTFVGTWAGDSTQTTMYVSALTPNYETAISVALSIHADMSSPVFSAGAIPSSAGFTKHLFTGLTPGTKYYRQAYDGAAHALIGTAYPCFTRRALGATGITLIAHFSCRQSTPASTACSDDIIEWFSADPTIECRVNDVGDNGYSNSMSNAVQSHEDHFAEQMQDPSWYDIANLGNRDYVGSDHDTNGTGKSNVATGDSDIVAANISVWDTALPFDVQDDRLRDKGRFGFREGHVAFGFPDTRSMDRSDPADKHDPRRPTDPTMTMLGANQLARLLADLQAAKDDGCAVYVLSTDPAWNGISDYPINDSQSDKWPSFIFERDLISDAANTIGIPLYIMKGDDHIASQDDGTNEKNGHAVIGAGPFDKQLHANYQQANQYVYPSGVKGSGDEVDGHQRHAMQYQRVTINDGVADAHKVTISATIRDCTPADTPGKPDPPANNPHSYNTMVKDYTIP